MKQRPVQQAWARREWFEGLSRASAGLAAGSALLLCAWFYAQTEWIQLTIVFVMITALALFVHAASWVGLFTTLFLASSPASRARATGMQAACAVSIGGFIVGVAAILPRDPYGRAVVLGLLLFAYVPIVYGPVVAAHGAIFLLAAKDLRGMHDLLLEMTAAAGLLAVAVVAISIQLLDPRALGAGPRSLLWALPGLAAIAYAVAALAWNPEAALNPGRDSPRSL